MFILDRLIIWNLEWGKVSKKKNVTGFKHSSMNPNTLLKLSILTCFINYTRNQPLDVLSFKYTSTSACASSISRHKITLMVQSFQKLWLVPNIIWWTEIPFQNLVCDVLYWLIKISALGCFAFQHLQHQSAKELNQVQQIVTRSKHNPITFWNWIYLIALLTYTRYEPLDFFVF